MKKDCEDQEVAEFEIQQLLPIGMTLVVLVIGLAYGLEVTDDVRDGIGETNCAARSDTYTLYNATANQCYNTTNNHLQVGTSEFNATEDGITAVAKIPDKLGMIVTIIVAAVIIGVLVRYLMVRWG